MLLRNERRLAVDAPLDRSGAYRSTQPPHERFVWLRKFWYPPLRPPSTQIPPSLR